MSEQSNLQRLVALLFCAFSIGLSPTVLADGPPSNPGDDDPYPPWMGCDGPTPPAPWCETRLVTQLTCDDGCADSSSPRSIVRAGADISFPATGQSTRGTHPIAVVQRTATAQHDNDRPTSMFLVSTIRSTLSTALRSE